MIVSHEGERIFLYAGTGGRWMWPAALQKFLADKGWTATLRVAAVAPDRGGVGGPGRSAALQRWPRKLRSTSS